MPPRLLQHLYVMCNLLRTRTHIHTYIHGNVDHRILVTIQDIVMIDYNCLIYFYTLCYDVRDYNVYSQIVFVNCVTNN